VRKSTLFPHASFGSQVSDFAVAIEKIDALCQQSAALSSRKTGIGSFFWEKSYKNECATAGSRNPNQKKDAEMGADRHASLRG